MIQLEIAGISKPERIATADCQMFKHKGGVKGNEELWITVFINSDENKTLVKIIS